MPYLHMYSGGSREKNEALHPAAMKSLYLGPELISERHARTPSPVRGIALPIRATITLWAQLEIRPVGAAKAVVSSHGRGVHPKRAEISVA
jgi:hypothetical protein